MSKIVVIGDLEGRTIWKEIIEKENPDLTIFLGDYVASRCVEPKQEVETLEELMEYKEANPDKVILLRGNHDDEALDYSWAHCYPEAPYVSKKWMKENKERFLNNTQWIYIDEDLKTIFSHAGISQVWLDETIRPYLHKINKDSDIYLDDSVVLENINSIEPCDVFGFIGDRFDLCGDSVTQSCTWIRPGTLAKCMIDGYTQVIGHTRVNRECIDFFQTSKNHLWLCDALNQKNYLIIEDGKFESKELF